MKVDVLMPQMGESVTEATVVKWHAVVGDSVVEGETLLEISTDKVDSEIPAPATGTLSDVRVPEGATVAVKSVIAVIDTQGAGVTQTSATAPRPAETTPRVEKSSAVVSPLARAVGAQHGLETSELKKLAGSGVAGRVTKSDVLDAVQSRVVRDGDAGDFAGQDVRVETMDIMRRRIAEHMVRSKATSPHVYTTAEVDMTAIARWREEQQPAFAGREGFKLSFTPIFIEATARALVQFPYLNASIDGESIILKKQVNIGCAVALGSSGLVVPVIRNADQLSLVGIARTLNDIAQRARSKKLSPDETQGGTFTITNPGIFGNIIGCPIINQPQVGILSTGAIKKRPWVVNDMLAIREIVYLTLSYDHRLVDGALAGQFLQFITKYLEGWDTQRESWS